jgi:DNA-binding NtrC family response regulator
MESSDYKSFQISLSQKEKASFTILLVEPDAEDAEQLRGLFRELGYTAVTYARDHGSAYKLLEERNFSHVVFSARSTNVPVESFVRKLLADKEDAILIPSSYDPNLDNVFELLRMGCRGFLVLPPDQEDLESAMGVATKGEAMSKKILHAVDRNQAFSALMSATLDKLAQVQRDAEKYDVARKELPLVLAHFQTCVKLGKTFAEGGEEELQQKMFQFMEKIGNGSATRLGRARKRLADKRKE